MSANAHTLGGGRSRAAVIGLTILAAVVALVYVGHSNAHLDRLNDFYREAWPSYAALLHGHLSGFFRLAPAYGGSLALRAPLAVIPGIWHGGSHAVYLASVVPCLAASVGFCVWLAEQPRRRGGTGWASRLVPAVLCIFNPVVLVALFGGHPEEILGAVLCVAAVVLAMGGRARWAAVAIALAVINKPWALAAVPVVFAALPAGRRKALAITSMAFAVLLVPLAIARSHDLGVALGADVGAIFNPPQLLWWFGRHAWITEHAREAIILIAVACSALWLQARRGRRQPGAAAPNALLLLMLVLLLRAALDPWNNLYYHVPMLFALVAYEVRAGRMPVMTMVASLVLLVVVPVGGVPHMPPDVRAAAYTGVVLLAVGLLGARLFRPVAGWRQAAGAFCGRLAAGLEAVQRELGGRIASTL